MDMFESKGRAWPPGVTDWQVAHLYYLVFQGFVDLACQAAAGDGVVDDELVGLEAGLLVEFGPWHAT